MWSFRHRLERYDHKKGNTATRIGKSKECIVQGNLGSSKAMLLCWHIEARLLSFTPVREETAIIWSYQGVVTCYGSFRKLIHSSFLQLSFPLNSFFFFLSFPTHFICENGSKSENRSRFFWNVPLGKFLFTILTYTWKCLIVASKREGISLNQKLKKMASF